MDQDQQRDFAEEADAASQLRDLDELKAAADLEDFGEKSGVTKSPTELPPHFGKKAILVCMHEVDYPRWESYLRNVGFEVISVLDAPKRVILDSVAQAEYIVVGPGWYNDSLSNLVLLLGRYVDATLLAAWDTETAAAGTPVQQLLPIPAASINPVEIGKVLRNG